MEPAKRLINHLNIAQIISVACASLLTVSLLSCRAGVDVQTVSRDADPPNANPPFKEPTREKKSVGSTLEIPDAVFAGRKSYQFSNVITIDVSEELGTAGDSMKIVNESTNETLLEEALLALDDDKEYYELNNKGIQLKVFPFAKGNARKFASGKNILRVYNQADSFRTSSLEIDIKDFAIFSSAWSGGVVQEGEQRPPQGQVSQLFPSFVSNGKSVLVTGFIPIITY
jgi:hypothetical protein